MAITISKKEQRDRKRVRIRTRIRGTASRPRLSVFKSARHIYAQVIDDDAGRTLAAASTRDKDVASGEKAKKAERAKKVGALVARRCLERRIEKVVFDRGGYPYHGRIKALAEAAREAGLKF
ncbi:MAG: 50S ribosomal protein L18 [Deltaproteobacteria bacterium]|nr:50S ribosomal protein L18 [Deltaproteobacteria bacterium]